MEFAHNDKLFPLPLPSPDLHLAPGKLEAALVAALWRNRRDIVHAYAVARRDGEEAAFPVSWTKPRAGEDARSLIARKVAELALLFAREGALLVGFR